MVRNYEILSFGRTNSKCSQTWIQDLMGSGSKLSPAPTFPSVLFLQRMRQKPSKKRSGLSLLKTMDLDDADFSYDLTPSLWDHRPCHQSGFLDAGGYYIQHMQTLWRWNYQEATELVVTLFENSCGYWPADISFSSLLHLGQDGVPLAPWKYT